MILWNGDFYPEIRVAPHPVKSEMPALFLDLDRTVRYSKVDSTGFIQGPGDVAVYSDVEYRLWEFRHRGYLIFGVTNQGGVAYGFKTLYDVDAEIRATIELFENNPFSLIKTCPYHTGGHVRPFNIHSLQRKPDYGMLVLIEEFVRIHWAVYINWANSIMIGDQEEDKQCANSAMVSFQWAWEFFGRRESRYD